MHFNTYHLIINTLAFVFLPKKPPLTKLGTLLINKCTFTYSASAELTFKFP